MGANVGVAVGVTVGAVVGLAEGAGVSGSDGAFVGAAAGAVVEVEPVGDIVVVGKEESSMLSLRTASSGSDATKYVQLPRCSHATLNPTTSAFRLAAVIWQSAE